MTEDLLKEIMAEAKAEDEKPDGIASASVTELGQELADLKGHIKNAEKIVSDLKGRRDEIRKDILPNAMKDAGLVNDKGKGGFTLEEGGRVHLRNETYVTCPKKFQVDFHAWLEANGHGDLIKPTVHSQTLKAFIKEQRAQGSEVPEHLLSIFDQTVAVAVGS